LHAIVADELLVSDQEPGEVTGLELAWHLMRCGRTAEATGYLLRGAREAIDHGSAWEAERAIVTGEPEIRGEQIVEGRLLLAEALLEQGRDRETRDVVLRTDSSPFPRWADMGRALATSALAYSPDQPVQYAEESFQELLELLKNSENSRARALAARGAAIFANKLGDQRVAAKLLEVTGEVATAGFSTIDLADLEYARATALYELRDLDASERWAMQAVNRLEEAGLMNSTLLGLYCGRGAIECARGHYAEAIPVLERAHSIAKRIGNQTIIRPCLSNLALCHLRLGDHKAQIRFGERACHRTPETQWIFGDVTYSSHLAMGYALSGDAHRAFDALASGDAAADRLASPWPRQLWLLRRADVLQILGRRVEAMKTAAIALGETFGGVLNWSYAGAYARWTALVVRTSTDAENARKEVQSLVNQLDHFDALDRAEILAAAVFLSQLVDKDCDREAELLREALRALPDSVAATMRKFGFLGTARPLGAARKSRRRRRSDERRGGDPGGNPSPDPGSPN
jgi:tetratricopeptide (TPR) repeat protein